MTLQPHHPNGNNDPANAPKQMRPYILGGLLIVGVLVGGYFIYRMYQSLKVSEINTYYKQADEP